MGTRMFRLNALSGIGGVQTYNTALSILDGYFVLMPCRALEAFRRNSLRERGRNSLQS